MIHIKKRFLHSFLHKGFIALSVFCACSVLVSAMDFSHCKSYYKQATTSIDSALLYAIKYQNNQYLIAFSKTPLTSPYIIKKDPFLGLYLFKGSTPLSYTLKPLDNFSRTTQLAAINQTQITTGKVLNFERGIFDLGKFSSTLPQNSVISNICYQIYGIAIDSHTFIPKNLIDRFLSQKGGKYGDIGIRTTEDKKGFVIVKQVDLFFDKNPFLPEDRILEINQKPIKSLVDFEWSVANLEIGSTSHITISRGGKKQTFHIKVDRRYGGGLITDSFLERFGVVIDSDMVIKKIPKPLPFALSQLSVGDKLIWINKTPIQKDLGFWHLRELLSKAGLKGEAELLVLHQGVEVFIHSKLK
ncbi:PDZ domain-containing protein [Helicobacter fennelliae]|uniref:DUF7488 domain-containing protein n=1 Tax=Helicobacter fennelliae TaxID=215 RepID=UPI000E0152D7|nr:PDZ domain-containing protein [Helicobacter fennelliae]STQ84134.1 Putative periplasmic protein [Helicobacter fennelliae]